MEVWRTGHVLADWTDGIIFTLYKGKGPKSDCGNHLPMTPLSAPGKVFANVLLARIQSLLMKTHRPQQSGFATGGFTINDILALTLLSKLHRELDRPLYVAYFDIKAAFDSVERESLYKALRSKGIPGIIFCLIIDLHQDTGASIHVGQKSLQNLRHHPRSDKGVSSLLVCSASPPFGSRTTCNMLQELTSAPINFRTYM